MDMKRPFLVNLRRNDSDDTLVLDFHKLGSFRSAGEGGTGEQTPPAFHLGKQGEQKYPFWTENESISDIDMIQPRSNDLYQ